MSREPTVQGDLFVYGAPAGDSIQRRAPFAGSLSILAARPNPANLSREPSLDLGPPSNPVVDAVVFSEPPSTGGSDFGQQKKPKIERAPEKQRKEAKTRAFKLRGAEQGSTSASRDHEPVRLSQMSDGIKYLNVKHVARRYDVSIASIWRWVSTGKLPPPRKLTPGATRWFIGDLEAFEATLGAG